MLATEPKFRKVPFPPVDLDVRQSADGTMFLSSKAPLELLAPTVAAGLFRRAEISPNKTAIAERGADGRWASMNFAELRTAVANAAQWMLDHQAGPSTPIMFISGNSVAHAIVRFAALAIGAPICPVSENYALLGASSGYNRLLHAVRTVQPSFVFAETGAFAQAVSAIDADIHVITREPDAFQGAVSSFDDLINTPETENVARTIAAMDPKKPAAYMLTSGSTGSPKAVIQTHAMMMVSVSHMSWLMGANGVWDGGLLEWLPWSHVSGLYVSISAAVIGAPYYIDGGRPMPGLFDQTIANIRDLNLKYFTNVPAGYAMLSRAMEQDRELRDHFFSEMQLMLFGGAALPAPVYELLQSQAVAATGQRVLMISGYGATETTTGCMSPHYETEQPGIGLPLPGLEVKLVPQGARYELRLRGPMITPGYLGQEDLNKQTFDPDGFYMTGDAAEFIDPARPEAGLKFAGRLKEDFKLATGTWVLGGALRIDILKALGPEFMDLLICGENRESVGVLAWPAPGAKIDMKAVGEKLSEFNAANPTSSRKIARFALLNDMPNSEIGELSAKGSVNQALAISNRAEQVERLYQTPAPDDVLVLD